MKSVFLYMLAMILFSSGTVFAKDLASDFEDKKNKKLEKDCRQCAVNTAAKLLKQKYDITVSQFDTFQYYNYSGKIVSCRSAIWGGEIFFKTNGLICNLGTDFSTGDLFECIAE